MGKIQDLLLKLNKEQIKPVLDTEGPVLVIAGAGSGKTRVLTSRIAYLVMEKQVSPSNIMAITFTNKAAGEMKERLKNLIEDVEEMWVSTIHSMCVRILRRDIDYLGYDKNFSIYDETDKDKVLKRVFEELGYEQDDFFKSAKNLISSAKNDCLDVDGFRKEYAKIRFVDEMANVYEKYEENLKRSNSLDFDDLLFKTYQLFVEHPEVANKYANKFQYVHIDEFQDTNKVQFAIARMLSSVHNNIFVVGDDDQSIYGWRGAKIENILYFDQLFKGAKVYKLEQNYRSTKKILQLANAIISKNVGRRPKELWTENQDGVRIETFVGNDENNEASFVAMQIKNLMARTDMKFSDFAVFMRVNAISRSVEQEFLKYNIPCKIYGGFRFFERKEIKDILAYLKLINNDSDDESFLRSISVPKRGIGDKTLRTLREYCASMGLSLYDGIDNLGDCPIAESAKKKLVSFKQLVESFKVFAEDKQVVELIDHVLETTDFLSQFEEKTEENTSKLYNISELKNSADQFAKDNHNDNLADYINSITLSSDTDDINEGDAVTIATIHASKGLEYPCVFLIGLDEKILPIARSIDDESEMEEERRLMYVAVTRAKERLYLTRATSRFLYGKRDYMTQSRFLKDAYAVLNPAKLYEEKTRVEKTYSSYGNYTDEREYQPSGFGYNSDLAKKVFFENKPKVNENAEYSKYKAGVKVKHLKFGVGTVINVKGEGDNVIVNVAFNGVGIKALSVKYAPMEIL